MLSVDYSWLIRFSYPRKRYEVPGLGGDNSRKRDTAIQRDETPVLPHSQRQQVNIGDLPRTQNSVPCETVRLQ